MAKVTLDLETFKALASTTRLQVLKTLDERRKTLSEISRDLELNKATVHEHLQVLVATGLVKKLDEGRKWIYYELSWQGQRLLHPQESTTFAVLLGLSVLAAGGSAVLFGQALGWWWQARPLGGVGEGAPPMDETLPQADAPPPGGDDAGTADAQDTAAPESGGNQTALAAEAPPDSDGSAGALPDSVQDDAGFWDESGVLAVLLLVTAALLAFVAWSVRRARSR